MPTYQPNIPLATDQLSQSQSDIQGNFQVLGSTGIPTLTPNYLLFPPQVTAPTVPSADAALYLNNSSQMIFVQPTSGNAIPFTTSASAIVGWTYIPSGLIMAWSNVITITSGNAIVVNFNTVFGATTPTWPTFRIQCFFVLATQLWVAGATNVPISTYAISTTGFTARIPTSTTLPISFQFLAMGF